MNYSIITMNMKLLHNLIIQHVSYLTVSTALYYICNVITLFFFTPQCYFYLISILKEQMYTKEEFEDLNN